MYVRTIQRRNKGGSVVRYLQLAHNVRKPGSQPAAKVIHSFGRENHFRQARARSCASSARGRWAAPGRSTRSGAASGIDKAIAKVAAGRKVSPEVERLIFALVANRALAPSSKRAALECARSGSLAAGDRGADRVRPAGSLPRDGLPARCR